MNKKYTKGMAFLGAGLLARSISSFLNHMLFLGGSTYFWEGMLDGLSAVFFMAAIYLLVKSRKEE